MTTVRPPAKICPNCNAVVPVGARQCGACKLAVSQMAAFAAAKQAAQRKGFKGTRVESGARPLWRHPMVLAGVAVCILVAAFILTRRPAPPPWTRFPATQVDTAKELLTDISKGDNDGFDRAYALVAPSVKNADDSDEPGKYEQLYLEVNKYLAGEFGPDWISTTTFEVDPKEPDLVIARVSLETLHVVTALQTPSDKVAPDNSNSHYAVKAINEFDISLAGKLQYMGAVKGGLRLFGAGGAIPDIQGIVNAGGKGRETAMQTKFRLLPSLRDPRHVNKFEVYQTWPVRKDPVVRRRLEAIVHDERYDIMMQQAAQEVLNDAVSLEDRYAANVPD